MIWLTVLTSGVLGIVGTAIGAFLVYRFSRRTQHEQWIRDNRKEEYRELIEALTDEITALVRRLEMSKDRTITREVFDEEREKHRTALRVLKNRIFIARDLKERNLFDEWADGLKLVWETGEYHTFEATYEKIREWIVDRATRE
jgi:hypothetical protein